MTAASDVVAIDGPAASGKSTVAKRVAAELGYLYVDSGSLYRGMAWAANRRAVDAHDPGAVARLAEGVDFELFVQEGAVRFRMGDVQPVDELRTEEVNAVVSPVAAVPEVRRKVVAMLRDMQRFGSLVVEGRDIGTAVFPDTQWKFYLDASAEERARRRHAESADTATNMTVEQVRDSIGRRDKIDSSRAMDPLTVAGGAVIIDTTGMEIGQVVAAVLGHMNTGETQ